MSKANKLASLAVDVNNLSELADQVTDIENAIVRANTNAQVIEGIADDIEALEANTADIMNDFASISNVFNSGITYSTDGENEYYDANSVTNTVATVDIIEMNIQNPQDGELLSYSTSANTWVNTPAPVIPEIPEIPPPVLSFRNKIVNGDMRIDQRNAGNSSTVNGAYTIDRWGYGTAIADKMTWGQNYNSINPPAGFTNYFGMKTTTAHTVGASEFFLFSHKIEGYNVADLKWGTSSAKTITMSFWVNSSLTGTFGLVLSNSAQDRSYPLTYTISLANTWEYKTITIPGETTGTWNTNNERGLMFYFGLGVGTDFEGTANNWNTTMNLGATGATSVVGTQDATWNITGVQLEEGEVATPFEHRPYDLELSLCQRYYFAQGHELFFNFGGSGQLHQTCIFPTTMRITPTVTYYANFTDYSNRTNPGKAHKDGVGSVDVARLSAGINHDIAILGSGQGSNHRLYRRLDAEL